MATPISLRQLAHELNSLLDGSLRCVQQVHDRLAASGATEPPVPGGSNAEEARKLDLAAASMRRMAEMLERVMRSQDADHHVLESSQPLGQYVPELLDSLRPQANEHQVTLKLHLNSDAASIPAGALGIVLLNGVKNAIDACASGAAQPRVVEISIAMTARNELSILIADTGPGVIRNRSGLATTKPHGHGIGLALCEQIVSELGGTLSLTNIPFGAGAVFQVRVPAPRLVAA